MQLTYRSSFYFSLPYIRVNMSVVSLEPTDGIWFVYDCVHAPDEEDNYCHERKSVLPCRGVRLTNKTEAVGSFGRAWQPSS